MLSGKKTYIVGIAGIVFAISGYVSGHLDLNSAVGFVLASLAAMGIRNGITSEVQALLPPPPQA